MKKQTLMAFIFIGGIIAVFAAVNANSQENVKSVQDSAFRELMRPQVPFQHDDHNADAKIEQCNECHHVKKDGKTVLDETSEERECSECHNSNDGKYSLALVMAYHTNCKGCHLEKKTGPITCAECHVK